MAIRTLSRACSEPKKSHGSMQDVEAILLDMDGVVIDSEPIHEEAQRIVFRDHALPVPETEFPSFKGMTERKVFERIMAEYGTDDHDLEVLIDAKETTFRSLLVDLELIPGALDFIAKASERYRLALTTSSARVNQEIAFEKFSLATYFEAVVTAEDIVNPKPHPQPYLTTAELLGLAPEVCLVVEDSLHGVRSARRAGCHVAGMTTSFDAKSLDQAGADFTVDTYADLAERLDLA